LCRSRVYSRALRSKCAGRGGVTVGRTRRRPLLAARSSRESTRRGGRRCACPPRTTSSLLDRSLPQGLAQQPQQSCRHLRLPYHRRQLQRIQSRPALGERPLCIIARPPRSRPARRLTCSRSVACLNLCVPLLCRTDAPPNADASEAAPASAPELAPASAGPAAPAAFPAGFVPPPPAGGPPFIHGGVPPLPLGWTEHQGQCLDCLEPTVS
jgi:hypothetical protein